MNVTYTRILGRKILLAFLIFTIIFSIAALVVRNTISKKLQNVSKLAKVIEPDQSKSGHALLLLHQADDDFQESLLNIDNKKIFDYKIKLSKAFGEIDALLKERADTTNLTSAQNNQIRFWYKRKVELSDKLYSLKHSFDSLLTVYADLHNNPNESARDFTANVHVAKESVKNNVDTIRKAARKGLFGRIKDAIKNKNTTEISYNKNTHLTDLGTQKIVIENRNAYLKKLQQLQQQNVKLLNMQKELIVLNTHIISQLERIINDVKDINSNISDEFKSIALKNYEETTNLLNKFYLADLFLVLIFAVSLIVFIVQLNRSELLLRRENEQSMISAQQKIDELIKKIVSDGGSRSVSKIEELEEIVHLAINNNPAFLMKFNEFDPEFIKKLLNMSPTFIATEIEFCVLLRLNFETKEIARYTKTSVRSVEGKKYRIRKKLDIPSDQDINIWMTNL